MIEQQGRDIRVGLVVLSIPRRERESGRERTDGARERDGRGERERRMEKGMGQEAGGRREERRTS